MIRKLKYFMAGALMCGLANVADAQIYQPDAEVPFDPSVVTGKLPNGLTYYIRANKKPEKRAEFYIVHHVGAILEDDNQNGLAHFTEHMAFNGTKNFPKKALLNYLETIGCKFGENVNAFTAQDVTCYNISSVPIEREGVIDSCLLILHDWSNYISFDADEIESERGVIREEWRTRGGARARLSDQLRPIIYANSRYGVRNVIGDTAVINHFDHEAIFDFYHKWYRPDLQAVIVVGDFDTAMMEKKIKDLFSTIPAVTNPLPKPVYELPDNDQPIVAIATDPEATTTNIAVYVKHPSVPDSLKTQSFDRLQLKRSLLRQMMSERMSDLLKKEEAPAINASISYSGFTPTRDVFTANAIAKPDQSMQTLELLLTEGRRMQQYGFTASEFQRAKANITRWVESKYLERDNEVHSNYVWNYFSYFIDNEPTPDITFYRDFVKEVLPGISLQEINQFASQMVSNKNVIITLTAPEKDDVKVADKAELLSVYNKVLAMKVSGYEEKTLGSTLMENIPAKGSIIKEKALKKFDTHELVLSNGIHIYYKKTNFKQDEVIMNAQSVGGLSQLADDDYLTGALLSVLNGEMGLGDYSTPDLQKIMAGKRASTSVSLGEMSEVMGGSASPDDLELMFQQVYLRFTKPRFDQQALDAYMGRLKSYFTFMALNPDVAFSDTISVMMSGHHHRTRPINAQRLEEMTLPKLEKIYRDRFADPASFTFCFVGNIDENRLKDLAETYLASLPAGSRKEKYIDRGVRLPQGIALNNFSKEMKTPKTSIFTCYSGDVKYNLNEITMLGAIQNILNIRYVASIREKEGATYGVSVNTTCDKYPVKRGMILLSFNTDPEKADRMKDLLHAEIDTLINQGPKVEDVQKTKEFFLKNFADRQIENGYWISVLLDNYFVGMDKTSNYEAEVKKLNAADIQKFVSKTFTTDRMVEVVMMPLVEIKTEDVGSN